MKMLVIPSFSTFLASALQGIQSNEYSKEIIIRDEQTFVLLQIKRDRIP
jgi:hypothetical protein